MTITNEDLQKLLYAQLCRALCDVRRVPPLASFARSNYDKLEFQGHGFRTESGAALMYSGVFTASAGGLYNVTSPFSLAFFGDAIERTNIGRLCVPHRNSGARGSVLAQLSILDFLYETYFTKYPVDVYIDRISEGTSPHIEFVSEYEDFRLATIKSLPYDLSLKFLEEPAKAA